MALDKFFRNSALVLALAASAGCDKPDESQKPNTVQQVEPPKASPSSKISSIVKQQVADKIDENPESAFLDIDKTFDDFLENQNLIRSNGDSPELQQAQSKLLEKLKSWLKSRYTTNQETGKGEYLIGIADNGFFEGGFERDNFKDAHSLLKQLRNLRLLQLNNFFGSAHLDLLNQSANSEIKQVVEQLGGTQSELPEEAKKLTQDIQNYLLHRPFNSDKHEKGLHDLYDQLAMYTAEDQFEKTAAYTYAVKECEDKSHQVRLRPNCTFENGYQYNLCISGHTTTVNKDVVEKLKGASQDPTIVNIAQTDLSQSVQLAQQAYLAQKQKQYVTATTAFGQAKANLPGSFYPHVKSVSYYEENPEAEAENMRNYYCGSE